MLSVFLAFLVFGLHSQSQASVRIKWLNKDKQDKVQESKAADAGSLVPLPALPTKAPVVQEQMPQPLPVEKKEEPLKPLPVEKKKDAKKTAAMVNKIVAKKQKSGPNKVVVQKESDKKEEIAPTIAKKDAISVPKTEEKKDNLTHQEPLVPAQKENEPVKIVKDTPISQINLVPSVQNVSLVKESLQEETKDIPASSPVLKKDWPEVLISLPMEEVPKQTEVKAPIHTQYESYFKEPALDPKASSMPSSLAASNPVQAITYQDKQATNMSPSESKPAVEVASKTVEEETPEESSLVVGGYVDTYFSYYSDKQGSPNADGSGSAFSKFATISPRNMNFGLNIAQLNVKFSSDRFRAQGTVHFGDIPTSSWASQGSFQFLQNANAGVRLVKSLWIDIGLFPTHIGTEVFLPKDNVTSSLAVATWHEPYYHAGIEISYSFTPQLFGKIVIANGFGSNGFVDNNKNKAVGFLLTYKPIDGLLLSLSNLNSDDSPDSDEPNKKSEYLFYNNFYVNYQNSKLTFLAGLDFGAKLNAVKDEQGRTSTGYLLSGLTTIKYNLHSIYSLYGRFEFFTDPHSILATADYNADGQIDQIKAILGGTIGFEVKPVSFGFLRVEGRYLYNVGNATTTSIYSGRNHRLEAMVNIGVYYESANFLKK